MKVYLNGFLESEKYVASLDNVVYKGQVKSYDGYTMIDCYETI
jgi:hypothetical protein